MDARTPVKPTQLHHDHCRPLRRDQSPGVPNRMDSWRVVTRDEIGRGAVRVARVGEGRSHDRCPRRAWNRWHHRLDRSCACGPVFREALNHVSRLGPERSGSPRSFLTFRDQRRSGSLTSRTFGFVTPNGLEREKAKWLDYFLAGISCSAKVISSARAVCSPTFTQRFGPVTRRGEAFAPLLRVLMTVIASPSAHSGKEPANGALHWPIRRGAPSRLRTVRLIRTPIGLPMSARYPSETLPSSPRPDVGAAGGAGVALPWRIGTSGLRPRPPLAVGTGPGQSARPQNGRCLERR